MSREYYFKISDDSQDKDPMELVLSQIRDRASFMEDCYDNRRPDELFHQLAAMRADLDRACDYMAQIGGKP